MACIPKPSTINKRYARSLVSRSNDTGQTIALEHRHALNSDISWPASDDEVLRVAINEAIFRSPSRQAALDDRPGSSDVKWDVRACLKIGPEVKHSVGAHMVRRVA